MARILAFVFASAAAGFLFAADGWLAWHQGFYDVPPLQLCLCAAPTLLVALLAHVVRATRPAVWMVACFAVLLALWSANAARRAIASEGADIIGLGFTPWAQLFAVVALLLPLLLTAYFHYHVARLDSTRQQTHRRGRFSVKA